MKKIAIVVFALIVVAVLALTLLPKLAWDGAANVAVHIQVIEDGTGNAIPNAHVKIVDSSASAESQEDLRSNVPAQNTDASGRLSISILCPAGGTKGVFGKTGSYIIEKEIFVEAQGFQSFQSQLADHLGGKKWPLEKRVFDAAIVLKRSATGS